MRSAHCFFSHKIRAASVISGEQSGRSQLVGIDHQSVVLLVYLTGGKRVNSTTKWIISTVVGVVVGSGGGAFAFLQYSSQQSREIGRIEAENSYLRNQIAQLKLEKEKLIVDLKDWDSAYRKIGTEFSNARSRLAALQNDECETIWLEVLSLENTASRADTLESSSERKQEIQNQISETKKTHQVCLSSRK
jgi:hypothetical protein